MNFEETETGSNLKAQSWANTKGETKLPTQISAKSATSGKKHAVGHCLDERKSLYLSSAGRFLWIASSNLHTKSLHIRIHVHVYGIKLVKDSILTMFITLKAQPSTGDVLFWRLYVVVCQAPL